MRAPYGLEIVESCPSCPYIQDVATLRKFAAS